MFQVMCWKLPSVGIFYPVRGNTVCTSWIEKVTTLLSRCYKSSLVVAVSFVSFT
jgi:hypothetical protein